MSKLLEYYIKSGRLWRMKVTTTILEHTGKLWTGHGKPFSHDVSLAHGWSTWPVFLLPRYLAGLHPLEPGWETIGISPVLAELDEVEYQVESPSGLIQVAIVIDGDRERGTASVTLPADTTGVISLPNPLGLLGCRTIRGYGEETITESVRK
jgi:hypothetical protein